MILLQFKRVPFLIFTVVSALGCKTGQAEPKDPGASVLEGKPTSYWIQKLAVVVKTGRWLSGEFSLVNKFLN